MGILNWLFGSTDVTQTQQYLDCQRQILENREKREKITPMAIETRLKISEHHKKNKNHFWKGGITSINDKIRNSK